MQGFLLELLFPAGWRCPGEIYWRFSDAEHAARRALADTARAVRVIPVRVSPDAVLELTGERQSVAAGEVQS